MRTSDDDSATDPSEWRGDRAQSISLGIALRVWWRIGWLSFGGPAGQVALMHKELVEKRRWISEERFLHALNYCMLLPGPEAQQLATYIGWLLHRTRGGLAAGLLFVFPGFVCILALSTLYASLNHLPLVNGLFFGLKAAVVALVIEALVRIGKRALRSRLMYVFAAASFVAIFAFAVPFPLIVASAALLGVLAQRLVPGWMPRGNKTGEEAGADSLVDAMFARGDLEHARPSRSRALKVIISCALLWFVPLGALAAALGRDHVFVSEGIFFSKSAVVTFGGAYAVLAYIAQRAVTTYGWLGAGEMVDGLGLAETTPGPLIMVVQFVGFMGAYHHPGSLPPLLAGVLGAVISVWVTFVPCFLWIFLGGPYIEALRSSVPLRAALTGITAAVAGVILNLSTWFGIHTLFGEVREVHFGPAHFLTPVFASVSLPAVLLAVGALLALVWLKQGVARTLAACAVIGLAIRLIF